MCRIALVITAIVGSWFLCDPSVEAAPRRCGGRVCLPVSHNQVIVEEQVIAVPVLTPVAVFQYLPPVTPGYSPLSGRPTNEEIDRLIRERIDALIKERSQENSELPMAREWVDPAAAASRAETKFRVTAVLEQRCASCHSTDVAKGGIILFNRRGELEPNVTRAQIRDAINAGLMPPNARGNVSSPVAVPASDRAIITQWANERE